MVRETVFDIRGYRVRALDAGTGPTLVFLHGAGGLSPSPLLELLSARYRVIAPEHPGFGPSDMPEWMAGMGDLAFFYLDLLKTLDLSSVLLVGHSLGGWLAAEIAIRDTSRLRALALLAPAGVRGPVPFGDIFLWSPEETARRSCADPVLAEQRARMAAKADTTLTFRNRAATAQLAWAPRMHNPQLPFWLHRVDVPTLLVWGECDEITPYACAEPYRRGIPGARLVALPGVGHALAQERPAEVADHLDAFFAEASR
jgi:pimeloyl-ACP methyl ester carboxylesterase